MWFTGRGSQYIATALKKSGPPGPLELLVVTLL